MFGGTDVSGSGKPDSGAKREGVRNAKPAWRQRWRVDSAGKATAERDDQVVGPRAHQLAPALTGIADDDAVKRYASGRGTAVQARVANADLRRSSGPVIARSSASNIGDARQSVSFVSR